MKRATMEKENTPKRKVPRFADKESLLRDGGPQAVTEEALRLWSVQYKQPPAEVGKEKGDPAHRA